MKNTFILLFMLMGTNILAQDSLNNFSYSRDHIITNGMKVLGSWGIANIGVGAIGWAGSKNGSGKYFYQMNTFWGITNVGLSYLD